MGMGVQVTRSTGADVSQSHRGPEINRRESIDGDLGVKLHVRMKFSRLNIVKSQKTESRNQNKAERAQDGARHVKMVKVDVESSVYVLVCLRPLA
jgi:hypothetical protein